MRKLIWTGVVLCGLLGGCASTPERTEEPAPTQPEFQPGESPKNTTSEEGKAPIQQLVIGQQLAPKDSVNIEGFRAFRDVMDVSVTHGGGCKEHTYTLAWDGEFQGGTDGTPVANLVLVHDGNEDRCKAIVMATPRFDLKPISQRFREKYGKATGAVDLALEGQPTVRYEF
ncbi:hypothetical protein [Pyxidicoccus trucidator]|uniref:hypothetical protein n=1 Tax=Pyxidicoccus trucidator TaxID=2709662 RepID=UPI0013D932D0|nr:hypothetical protein [Pyxidicoccus trucidator]